MDNCENVLELISSQIDGEITDSELQTLQAHLSTCENCSAIQALYIEMSAAISEDAVPAPESLRVGVMEIIRSGENDNKDAATAIAMGGEGSKKKPSPIFYLKRFLPAAACLALILITIPLILNDNANYLVSPAPADAPAASAPVTVGGAVVPDVQRFGDALTESAESVQDDYDADFHAAAAEAPMGRDGIGAMLPSPASDLPGIAQFAETEFEVSLPDFADGTLDVLRAFDSLINESYAIVEITGDFPSELQEFESASLGDWSAWSRYIRLPREVAVEVIDEIRSHEGVTVISGDQNSAYVVILYGLR